MTARKGRAPGRGGFTWRGIRFEPPASTEPGGFYSSEPIELGGDARTAARSADWRVHRPKSVWHARLRIGSDRYPGVGNTPAEALEMAAAEAASVATYIVAMLPAASSPAPRRSKRPRRGSICNGGP